jgi:hypothetical protein
MSDDFVVGRINDLGASSPTRTAVDNLKGVGTTTFITTGVITGHLFGQPRKPAGWCDENGVEHAWGSGPLLLSYPAHQTRKCMNCGKTQAFQPGEWYDYP